VTPELVGVLVIVAGFVIVYAVSAESRLRRLRTEYNEAWEGWNRAERRAATDLRRADRAYAVLADALQQVANALPDPTHRYVVPSEPPDNIEDTRSWVQNVVDRALVGLALAQRRPTMDDVESARSNYQRLTRDLIARRDDDRQKIDAWRRLIDQVERALRGEQLTRGHDDPRFSPVVEMALNLRRDEQKLRAWQRDVAVAENLRIPYDEVPGVLANVTAPVTDAETEEACDAYLRSTNTPRKHKSVSMTGMNGALNAFLAGRIGRDE